MKVLRMALGAICVGLMAGGYYASQLAYFRGSPGEYAARMDQPGVRYLALAILVGAIAFGLSRGNDD
ncbi:MAG TPA: hypothetical protein PKA27_09035 [Fimbriimonadaceae bacterium]|nr:hypothetical protein [Fimbriimonadaceae bacterium]